MDNHETTTTEPIVGEARGDEPQRVAPVAAPDSQASRAAKRPTGSGLAGSHELGSSRVDAPTPEHRLRSGHRAGVPTPATVDQLEDELAQAFQRGPTHAWAASKRVLALAQEAVVEAGRARFLANFGSDVCDSCDGLKAGPGVVATCFQRRQCFFTHFKTLDMSNRQQRVINSLTPDTKRG